MAVALSSNPGRIAINRWVDITVPEVYTNLNRWFEKQKIIGFGEYLPPLSIYRILKEIARPSKDSSLGEYKNLASQLLESSLEGRRVPWSLLSLTIQRIRATPGEEKVSPAKARILKLFLLDHNTSYRKDELMELDQQRENVAYQCGRLLSVLNNIQRKAVNGVNTTIIERFFSSASTSPRTVFPSLIRGTQPHLAKLRKVNPGAAFSLEESIADIMGNIKEFPKSLPLSQQAEFSLGFYHQKQYDILKSREYKLKNNKNSDTLNSDVVSLDNIETEG